MLLDVKRLEARPVRLLFVMFKEVTIREIFTAFLYGILILAAALIPPVIFAIEKFGGA